MPSPSAAVAALDRAGYRLTVPRRAVADLIAARHGTFTAADLADDARAGRLRLGRATLFRAIDLLVELGVVERLDLPSGEHAYVGCEPVHHHHVVCARCGRTSEFDDAELTAVVAGVAERTGYRIDLHRLELFGRCPDCRASGMDGPAGLDVG